MASRPNDCSVTLPVEIDVKVKVRSKCNPYGSSRTRGGMSLEYPPEQENMLADDRLAGGGVKTENTNGPLPVLKQILKKQQKILKNLASSTPISLSSQKKLSLLPGNVGNVGNDHNNAINIIPQLNEMSDLENEHTDDDDDNDDDNEEEEVVVEEDEEIKQNDNDDEDLTEDEIDKEESKKRNKSPHPRKIITRNEMDSFSNDIKINSNLSFENDDVNEKQDNKKLNKKGKKNKIGKTNFPSGSAFDGEENSYQFDIQASQMVELFNRRKLKVTKINQTSHPGGRNKIEMDKEERTVVQKDKNY